MAGGTDGNLITYDVNGDPAAVATGTATHVLTSNGPDTVPTFQAAGGGGGKLELVGTTSTLRTSGTYDDYFLSFTAIDMADVTELIAVTQIEPDINSTGFQWNDNTSNYTYGGRLMDYSATFTSEDYGGASNSMFESGHWKIGRDIYNGILHLWLNVNEGKIYAWSVSTGEDGSAWTGGFNTTSETTIDSVTVLESNRDLVAGGRLTVYKVTR